jgi:DNA (cytosine-5)-methyltransferase 1
MTEKRGQLFFEIARIAEYHKPKVLFLENVSNLEKHDGGKTLQVILNTLDQIGYEVHYQILKASDYGVAQIRKRIYIVCFRKDLKIDFSFPEPTFEDVAIEDFLEPIVDEKYFIDTSLVTFYKPDITTRTLDTYRLGYVGHPGQGCRVYSIKGAGPAFVCTGIGPLGQTEGFLINGRVRKLTPSEAKRIMGFPESFIFPVSDTRAYEQIGNSVAVPVLKAIAQKIHATGVFHDNSSSKMGTGENL